MDPTIWIIIGCFVWMVVGVFALGITSDRLKSHSLFLPSDGMGFDFFPGGEIFGVFFIVIWLLAWPLVLVVGLYAHRYKKHIDYPVPADHQLHQIKLAPGVEGITVTALQPTGKVEVGGVTYDAQLQQGHVEAGKKVVVVGMYMGRTMVKRVD